MVVFVSLGLSIEAEHGQQSLPGFSRRFERCPVLVGRDQDVANCVLADTKVSRLHASFDIRSGAICVRDSGSTNGTFVNGERVPHDRWVVAGTLDGPCEIRISEWTLRITACEVVSVVPSDDFLTTVPPEPVTRASRDPRGELSASGTLVPHEGMGAPYGPFAGRAQSSPSYAPSFTPGANVGAAWVAYFAAQNALLSAVQDRLDKTPTAQRAEVAREMVNGCPNLEQVPGMRAVFERHGAVLPHTLESGSAMALQELARWYVTDEAPIADASEAFSFARKLKAGIDELLLGLVPMFAGLDRFEQQMDLRPSRSKAADPAAPPRSIRVPRVPRDAARVLFNWRDPTDASVRAVRTDLVDLTMHQVAVLNGVMRGVKQLLAELAPGTIYLAWQKKVAHRSAFGKWLGKMFGASERWRLYEERHGDLADEENERFRVIFGPEFAAEYKQSGEPALRGHVLSSPPALARANGAPRT